MIDDEKIIDLFFERSEQGIRELDIKYGKICHNLSYNIVNSRQDAEECVNDAYLGAWNAIPPVHPNPLLSYIVKIVRNNCINRPCHRQGRLSFFSVWFSMPFSRSWCAIPSWFRNSGQEQGTEVFTCRKEGDSLLSHPETA